MMSIRKRIRTMGIRATVTYVGNHYEGRYNRNDWKIQLRHDGKQYTFPMTTGDVTGEPDIETVLDCIVMDAVSYYNSNDFRDFCDEFGWEIDEDEEAKKKARKAYNGCERAYRNLNRVFGRDGVRALMYETERL